MKERTASDGDRCPGQVQVLATGLTVRSLFIDYCITEFAV